MVGIINPNRYVCEVFTAISSKAEAPHFCSPLWTARVLKKFKPAAMAAAVKLKLQSLVSCVAVNPARVLKKPKPAIIEAFVTCSAVRRLTLIILKGFSFSPSLLLREGYLHF